MCKKNPAHMKSHQAKTKNKTLKSFSNHLSHKLFKACSCPTYEGSNVDWTVNDGFIIDSLNGT